MGLPFNGRFISEKDACRWLVLLFSYGRKCLYPFVKLLVHIYAIFFTEWKNGDENDICKNTRGIIFYSTPHRGSRMAALKQATQMLLWPSIEVQELREGESKMCYYFW